MTVIAPLPNVCSAWFDLSESTALTYRLDPTVGPAGSVLFTFLGPAELELSIPAEHLQHYRDQLNRALTELATAADG